jgi:BirA family biotin operon repressor/biotin-[acetyl-CoA-carboxylase] ligase
LIWQGRSTDAWAEAWGVPVVEAHARIGSTNDRALELAAAGARAFSVVIADEQTAGRGRRGARWHSPPGSGLWMSVVLSHGGASPHTSLLVGLAVAHAIEDLAAGVGVAIKWPNDLMIRGGKVGGILCESAGTGVVAGIGINLRSLDAPSALGLAYRATSLETESGKLLSASEVAAFVLRRLKARSLTFDAEAGADLAGRDALSGSPVETEEHGRGIARGIDRSGALLLERPDGSRVSVVAGSVRSL